MRTPRNQAVTQTYRARRRRAGTFHCDGCAFVPPMHFPGAAKLLHAHHIVPLHAGGDDSSVNLVLLCFNCHAIVHLKVADYWALHPRYGPLWTGPVDLEELQSLFTAARQPRGHDAFIWLGDAAL
jgi:5-methylcytosine-specific restriction endonuclease McrA